MSHAYIGNPGTGYIAICTTNDFYIWSGGDDNDIIPISACDKDMVITNDWCNFGQVENYILFLIGF